MNSIVRIILAVSLHISSVLLGVVIGSGGANACTLFIPTRPVYFRAPNDVRIRYGIKSFPLPKEMVNLKSLGMRWTGRSFSDVYEGTICVEDGLLEQKNASWMSPEIGEVMRKPPTDRLGARDR